MPSAVSTATVLVSAIDTEGAAPRGRAAHVAVEPDGRFVVSGPPVEERLSVRAIAPGFLRSTEQIVMPGASDLSISMQPAARWTGRLLLDADIPPESLVVVVIQPGRRERTVPASERIAVDGLEAGKVDVEVRTRTGDWLVEHREQLHTSNAGTGPEAEEIALDLRGRLARLQLQLARADGTAFDRVRARVQPEGWPESGAWIRAGRLELVVPGAAATITVQPRGHAARTLGVLAGLQELTWPLPP